MADSTNAYRMTHQEIDALRQDSKDAMKFAKYLVLLAQIEPLDLTKEIRLEDAEKSLDTHIVKAQDF